MPQYEFRCKNCQAEFAVDYASVRAYTEAVPTCPNCKSTELARLIKKVTLQPSTRDYTRMSSQEMLSVFESGDSRQVGEMFQQVGGTSPELGAPYHDATKKLLAGESMDKVERELQQRDTEHTSKKSDESSSGTNS